MARVSVGDRVGHRIIWPGFGGRVWPGGEQWVYWVEAQKAVGRSDGAELAALANAYWDITTWRGVTPYIGAGIGASRNTIWDFTDNNVIQGGQGWAPTGRKWSLAWALHAGAGIQVNNNLTVDLGYSFVSLGDAQTGGLVNSDPITYPCPCTPMTFKDLYSHDLKLGVRWAFDQPY